ncbi:MAG: SGNH/GDSL hydrolase family protein [Butyrivibrio sp.]|nr:SGNH/GDSL hydrolase family protein [Butyrivibrio sp.]MBP3813503.1 SGNH/GDSL hydrolase family protein [Butyrivibrio sp.]
MSSEKRDENKKNGGFSLSEIPIWAHVAVLAVIAVVIIFTAYKLIKWNAGNVQTEGVVEGDFEVEVQDQVFLLPDDKKAMHEDDGVETILFLGNDILTYYSDENGLVEQVAKKAGATCINAGFPSTTVALKKQEFDPEYPLDAFSFYNVSKAIATRDFSLLHNNERSFEDSRYYKGAALLEGLDMNTVDTLVIFYDAQDYIGYRIGMNPDNDSDPVTYSGALFAGVKAIQEAYPFIRIVCMSFPMCYAYDASGSLVNGDMYDFGNGRLTTYYQFMMDVCGATGVTFIDNYYGTIHEDNSSEWLLDNIHVNAACNEHMAQHFVNVIYGEN